MCLQLSFLSSTTTNFQSNKKEHQKILICYVNDTDICYVKEQTVLLFNLQLSKLTITFNRTLGQIKHFK